MTGSYGATLRSRGMMAFLWTQFLGAFNDNVSKIIVTFVAMTTYGEVQGAAIVAAVFILPFLLFSGYAGYLADKVSKRRVLVSMKVFEIAVMALAIPGLMTGHVELLLAVMFLMGVHSTFFSPSKYGIVPELVPEEQMSAANGLLEMSTFAAIVLGTAFGGVLFERWHDQPTVLGGALMSIAAIGLVTSFGVPRVPAAKPSARLSLNPWSEVWRGAVRLWPDATLWGTLLGIAYFWFLGALLQTALLPFGQDLLQVSKEAATRLYTPLAFGIAIGSLVAGRLSHGRIEVGLVPVGSIGLGLFALAFAWSSTYLQAAASLAALGFFGGFFAVPLNALLQQRPADDEKGRVQATNNFVQTVGILIAAGSLSALSASGLSMRRILELAGVLTLLMNFYILWRLPDFFVRFRLWLFTQTSRRLTVIGHAHVPPTGATLLVSNHVGATDGLLIAASVQRPLRSLAPDAPPTSAFHAALLKRMRPIAIGGRPVADVIADVRAELSAGRAVCIIADGAVNRTPASFDFTRHLPAIVEGMDAPIVPVYIDEDWDPRARANAATVAFGTPLGSRSTPAAIRQAITETGTAPLAARRSPEDRLQLEFIRSARRHASRLAMVDSTGQKLTYGRALIAGFALGRAITRRTPGEEAVGTLLPASVGGALTNIALLTAGKTPINLNFTLGQEMLDASVAQAGIRTILTSRVFLTKAVLPEMPSMVFLEDLRGTITGIDKIAALISAKLLPLAWFRRRYRGTNDGTSPLLTVIFSSGSTGVPKGVMLTHTNVLVNVDSFAQLFPVGTDDTFIGVLPFFHSFGFTCTLWFPLLRGCTVAYHPNPMDAKVVGELAETYHGTMLVGTATFCAAYVRRCTKEQFASLRYAIVGAEKLRATVARDFEERFGLALLEGYGMTEMAPVVSVNRSPNTAVGASSFGNRPGSVGVPIPGVAAKIVDRDTGEELPIGEEGLLLVKGANMMRGYLHEPARTADVTRDGWYVTGDIAKLDDDGFIFITDRLSRFSKIGGEMVPHLRIEDAINALLGEAACAITAIPDEAKGERLVAFYVAPDVTPEQLWSRLNATDLPRLWIPKRESLVPIEAIPVLGSGKLDLRSLRALAIARASRTPESDAS